MLQEYGDTTACRFYDRFFLGGQNTLRGFEYRDVGPKASFGEPIGGKSYGYFSLEYSADIVAPMRFALFYDAGFVNKGAYDFNPPEFNDKLASASASFCLASPCASITASPLRLIRVNNKGGQFNFTFGSRF